MNIEFLNEYDKENVFKLIDLFPFPLIVVTEQESIIKHVYLNEQFKEEIGYNLDDIPTIDDWYLKAYPNNDYRIEVISAWNKLVKAAKDNGGKFAVMESLVSTKKNGSIWYEIKASMNKETYFVAFISIQEIVNKNEQLKQVSIHKDKMLSLLSHDIRGPLTNLYTISTMVLNKELKQDEFIEMMKILNEQSMRVLELVETTVQWARSNFDKINLKNERVNISLIVKEILDIYKNVYQEKDIKISVEIDENQVLATDQLILRAILRNIISNSIKFTPHSGKIFIKYKDKRITISDTGVGMDPMLIYNILHKDYTSNIGTQNEKGMGIGLKLVRDLIEKIHAKMNIKSNQELGTIFSVDFPS